MARLLTIAVLLLLAGAAPASAEDLLHLLEVQSFQTQSRLDALEARLRNREIDEELRRSFENLEAARQRSGDTLLRDSRRPCPDFRFSC